MSEVEQKTSFRDPQEPDVEVAIEAEVQLATEVFAGSIELFATAVNNVDPTTPPEEMVATLQRMIGSVARRSFLKGMEFANNHQPEEGEK